MMIVAATGNRIDTIAQFVTAIIVFIFVLALTYFVTRWLADLQKQRINSQNIEVIETYKVTTNKYIQIIRTGSKYYSVAICKDTVTLLGELKEEDIEIPESNKGATMSFKEILDKAKSLKTR